jgi:hypothetical protein
MPPPRPEPGARGATGDHDPPNRARARKRPPDREPDGRSPTREGTRRRSSDTVKAWSGHEQRTLLEWQAFNRWQCRGCSGYNRGWIRYTDQRRCRATVAFGLKGEGGQEISAASGRDQIVLVVGKRRPEYEHDFKHDWRSLQRNPARGRIAELAGACPDLREDRARESEETRAIIAGRWSQSERRVD